MSDKGAGKESLQKSIRQRVQERIAQRAQERAAQESAAQETNEASKSEAPVEHKASVTEQTGNPSMDEEGADVSIAAAMETGTITEKNEPDSENETSGNRKGKGGRSTTHKGWRINKKRRDEDDLYNNRGY